MTDALRDQWDGYWRDLPDGTALWDADPERAVAAHLPLLERCFDPDLPIVDVGCGNGTQTRFLATRFARVVGVDIAESAITLARTNNPAPNVDYRVLDVLDTDAVDTLHAEISDANVYLRAVLHQLPWTRRWQAARALAGLAGSRGHLFTHELTARSIEVVAGLLAEPEVPPGVRRLARHFGFGAHGGVPDDTEWDDLLHDAGFEIVASDGLMLHTVDTLPDGSPLELPTRYVLARGKPW